MFAPITFDQEINLLDLGSSGCRYVQTKQLARYMHISELASITPRLLHGVHDSGQFAADAASKALALFSFAGRTGSKDSLNEAIGTEVFRIAKSSEVEYFLSEGKRLFRQASPHANEINFEVISGADEAARAAKGVIYSFPRAKGLIMHIGAGSVDISYVENGVVLNTYSLSMGAEKLKTQFKEDYIGALKFIRQQIAAISWLPDMPQRGIKLYVEGGNCRALGRTYIKKTHHPIDIIHGLEISGSDDDANNFFQTLYQPSFTRSWKSSTRQIIARSDTLPFTAMIIQALREKLSGANIVFSETGTREGRFYELMSDDMRRQSPLLVSCPYDRDIFERATRLKHWVDQFIPMSMMRSEVLEAICLLSDWGATAAKHNKDLAGYEKVMRHNFGDCSHQERAFMAIAVYARFGGKFKADDVGGALALLPEAETSGILEEALLVGHVIGLAYQLGNVFPHLARAEVKKTSGELIISLPPGNPYIETSELAHFVEALEQSTRLKMSFTGIPLRQPFSPPRSEQGLRA